MLIYLVSDSTSYLISCLSEVKISTLQGFCVDLPPNIHIVIQGKELSLAWLIYKTKFWFALFSILFSSVTQSCPTLCDPMNCSTPGFPVHHQLPEFTQTHVHRVSDAIQPSYPLSSPSPPAPNPFQHQSLFQWVSFSQGGQSIGVSALAPVLPMNTQYWSLLRWTGWISLQSKEL